MQQGLFIALGYQDSFSWKSVAAGAVAGALTGIAKGVELGKITGILADHAKIATRALEVAASASKQIIENGKITSWSSLAVAGIGADKIKGNLGTALQYVTPWLGAAESYIRTGKVTPADWAAAIGGTIVRAIEGPPSARGTDARVSQTRQVPELDFKSARFVTNLIVGGVLSRFDKEAGFQYIANSVGQEVENYIQARIAAAGTGLITVEAVNGDPATGGAGPAIAGADPRTDDDALNQAAALEEGLQEITIGAEPLPLLPGQPIEATMLAPITAPSIPRLYLVKEGDSISKIIGTSDPVEIGLFMQANGLTSSAVQPGQVLAVPNRATASVEQLTTAEQLGLLTLQTDNARLVAVQQSLMQEALAVEAQRLEARAAVTRVTSASTETTAPGGAQATDTITQSVGQADSRVFAEQQASTGDYWTAVQDRAVERGSILGYAGAGVMRFFGDVGFGIAETAVAMWNDPGSTAVGMGKAVVNFGPEAFNAATNLAKTSLDGYTLLAEATVLPEGTFAGFRETDPYNITLLAPYDNRAEQGGAFVTGVAVGIGVTKYDNATLRLKPSGPTTLNPNEIRFSQETVSFSKSRPGTPDYTYDDIVTSMRTDGWKHDPIDVVRLPEGGITTIDNTRVLAAREAGIDVRATVHQYNERLPADMSRRFEHPTVRGAYAETWGEALEFRVMRQSTTFQTTNPTGTLNAPRVTGRQ